MSINELEKIKSEFTRLGLHPTYLEHEPVITSEDAAKTRGFALKQGIKALLFTDGKGGWVIVDVPAKVGLGRLKSKDRLESEPVAFHERVRQEFLSLSMQDPERYLVVDGRQSVSAVEKIIRAKVNELKVLNK